MKKFLFVMLVFVSITTSANAQRAAKVQMDKNLITFYDEVQGKYIPSFEYKQLYGEDAYVSAIDRAIEDNSILPVRNFQGVLMYYHRNTNKYYSYERMAALFGQENADEIMNNAIQIRSEAQKQTRLENQTAKNERIIRENAKIMIKSNNLIAGCSMIGGALGIYAIGNELIAAKASKVTDPDKMKKIRSSQSAVAWISGTVSLAGVVVILTGIQKVSPEGLPVAKNTFIDSADGGLKLTMKF